MAGKRLVLCQFRSEVHVYGRPNWFKMTRYDITESISKMLAVNRLTRWLQAEAEGLNKATSPQPLIGSAILTVILLIRYAIPPH